MSELSLFGRTWSLGQRPLVIAELSGNHGGSLDSLIALLEQVAASGVDAVKIQTYEANRITLKSDTEAFQVKGELWAGRTLYDLYKEAQTPFDWHEVIFRRAQELKIPLFSAPFDYGAVDLLERLDCPVYKIASCELIDQGLIEAVASTGKPLIVSTGMGSLDEIRDALKWARLAGAENITLLHCVSAYPTRIEQANIARMRKISEIFGVPVGFSDHTTGGIAALTATALGAAVIEKHVKLKSDTSSVDAQFSMSVDELPSFLVNLEQIALSIGGAHFGVSSVESESARFRRSLFVTKAMNAGDIFDEDCVRSVRPAGGMPPSELKKVLGRRASRAIDHGEPLLESMVQYE